MWKRVTFSCLACLVALPLLTGCTTDASLELCDAEVENIVRRSYQYVALYNVINKAALDPANPMGTGGFNKLKASTALQDHTLRMIARPNNDSLYNTCMLDLRKDPVILDIPAFDSKYVSLMAVAYDHYVNVPLATRLGDFGKPERVLFYTERTEGYDGEPVEGIDTTFEMSGDFVIAVFRVMPHTNEPERFARIIDQINSVNMLTLSEYRGGEPKPIDDVTFPAFGEADADIFGNNLLEVMQFVFNHTTFDPNDGIDQGLLAAYAPLGVEPGKTYDASAAAKIDGDAFSRVAQEVQARNLALLTDPAVMAALGPRIHRAKGDADLDALVAGSVIGPIGLPLEEATCTTCRTASSSQTTARSTASGRTPGWP